MANSTRTQYTAAGGPYHGQILCAANDGKTFVFAVKVNGVAWKGRYNRGLWESC